MDLRASTACVMPNNHFCRIFYAMGPTRGLIEMENCGRHHMDEIFPLLYLLAYGVSGIPSNCSDAYIHASYSPAPKSNDDMGFWAPKQLAEDLEKDPSNINGTMLASTT